MPSCCVMQCGARKNNNRPKLTLHRFPANNKLRMKWIEAIGRENINSRQNILYVCSMHFDENCINRTLDVTRLRDGAVPSSYLINQVCLKYEEQNPLTTYQQDATSSSAAMVGPIYAHGGAIYIMPHKVNNEQNQIKSISSLQHTASPLPHKVNNEQNQIKSISSLRHTASPLVCRICLAMNSKLFPIRKYKLDQAYEHLTGMSLCAEIRLPQHLCAECAQRLIKLKQFRQKSLKANTLMMELLKKQYQLTTKNIQTISRENNQLTSDLTIKSYEPDHCNMYILEDEQADILENTEALQTEYQPSDLDTDIKNEHEALQTEYQPSDLDTDIKNEQSINEELFINEHNDDTNHIDNDFEFRDEDYSSDDSLTIEVAKSKKEEKSKVKEEPETPKVGRRRKLFLNETLFSITDLTVEEQIAEIEKRKESNNYKYGVFKCVECYKGFLDEDAYNSHVFRHTTECGDHRCNICKIHFKYSRGLRKHLYAHHAQRFSCSQCQFVTTHRQSATLHERWHDGMLYECPHCLDVFVKFSTYMGHIRIKHPSDIICQLCGYSFISEKGLQLHKKLKHRTENMQIPEDGPLCELCNIRFRNPEALRRHVNVSARHNTVDKDGRDPNRPNEKRKAELRERGRLKRDINFKKKAEGPIPCEQCGVQLEDSRAYHGHFRRMHPDKNRTKFPSMKSPCMCEECGGLFQSYTLLRDHRRVHTGERPFSCDSCGKSFRMKQSLLAHLRVHSSEKATYACSLCEKHFSSYSNRQRHMFSCHSSYDSCGKCFRVKQRLVSHRRVHRFEKAMYGCGLCGKHFSTHSNRQRHMFAHTGLKPFKCEMCGKAFKHGCEKRAHITYVHMKKPWPKRNRGKRRSNGRKIPMANPQAPPGLEMDDPKMDIAMEITIS